MNKLVFCGNPNTGKTTIFNSLTKSDERVGNFHGVTVREKEKIITIMGKKYLVVDLPGIYSLDYYSIEEKVSVDYIKNLTSDDIIICTIDVNSIKKNLYLYTELTEIGYSTIMCVNDIMGKNNYDINGFNSVFKNVVFFNKNFKKNLADKLKSVSNNYPCYIFDLVKKTDYLNLNLYDRFFCIKGLENSNNYQKDGFFCQKNHFEYLVRQRYNLVKKNTSNLNLKLNSGLSWQDKILLGKYSFFILTVVVSVIFLLCFNFAGNFFTDKLEGVGFVLRGKISDCLNQRGFSEFFIKFLTDGVLIGTTIVLSFLPQLFMVYLCMSFLEESGYVSRVSFTLDKFLSHFGLNGKSVFTFLMGFGCSSVACYQARTNENAQTRAKMAIASPYISCSAKIPLYVLLTSIFFKKTGVLIIILLYMISILSVLIVLKILSHVYDKTEESFLLELSPLRNPDIKSIIKSSFRETKEFLVKTGTIIITVNIIVFVISNCGFDLVMVNDYTKSILYSLGEFFCFIFRPLGFSSPIITSSLICGFVAKEVIVSTLGIFTGGTGVAESIMTGGAISFTTQSAFCFMLFAMLYCPCLSNYVAIKEELGANASYYAIFQFVYAYIVTFLANSVISMFKMNKSVTIFLIACVILILLILMIFMKKKAKKSKKFI